MHSIKHTVLIGIVVCFFSLSARALDLMEAVMLAEHHDAAFMAAMAQYQADTAAVGVVRGGLLPNIGMTAAQVRNQISLPSPLGTIRGTGTSYAWAVQMNQALFDLATYDKYRSSRHVAQASYQQLRLAWFALVMKTTQAYFDVLSARLSLSAILLSERAMYQHYLMAKRNFTIGNSSIVDMLQAKASLDSISAQRIQVMQSLGIKRLNLIHLIGEKLDHLSPLTPHTPYPVLGRNHLIRFLQEADVYAPTILMAEEGEEAAHWSLYAAHAAYLPKFSMSLSRGFNKQPGMPSASNPQVTPGNPVYNTTLGLQMNWSWFAGGAMRAGADQVAYLHEKALQQWIDVRRQTFLDLETHYALYTTARAQEAAYAQAVSSAETLLKAVSLGYTAGSNSMLDLLDAEKQLFMLRQQWVESQLSGLLSYLRVKVTAGILSLHDIDQLNTSFFHAPSKA